MYPGLACGQAASTALMTTGRASEQVLYNSHVSGQDPAGDVAVGPDFKTSSDHYSAEQAGK